MTEIADINASWAKAQFILCRGDMGSQRGINRSVAQIHAVLFLRVSPLNAGNISAELGIARLNVSNSLKELVGWQLTRRVPVPGDHREHFVAEVDIPEMAMRFAQSRKEREIDPAMSATDSCVQHALTEPHLDPIILARMRFLRTLSPGALVIGQHDRGDEPFRFLLDLNHWLFDRMIYQDAVFNDGEEYTMDNPIL